VIFVGFPFTFEGDSSIDEIVDIAVVIMGADFLTTFECSDEKAIALEDDFVDLSDECLHGESVALLLQLTVYIAFCNIFSHLLA
jgi:hypothetical protein